MGFRGGALLLAGVVLFAAMVALSPTETGIDSCTEDADCMFTSVEEGSPLEEYAIRTVNLGQSMLVACANGAYYEGKGFVPESDCRCLAGRCRTVPRGVPRVG